MGETFQSNESEEFCTVNFQTAMSGLILNHISLRFYRRFGLLSVSGNSSWVTKLYFLIQAPKSRHVMKAFSDSVTMHNVFI